MFGCGNSAAAASDLGVTVKALYATQVPKSAKTPEAVLQMVGLTAQDIANACQKMFDESE